MVSWRHERLAVISFPRGGDPGRELGGDYHPAGRRRPDIDGVLPDVFRGSDSGAVFDPRSPGTTEEVEVAAVPNEYALENNYPNPFNPTTTINFQLPQDGHAELAIYNMVGQKVATLVNGQVNAGYHSVTWEAGNHPSGIYLYRLEAGDFTQTHRMVLLK